MVNGLTIAEQAQILRDGPVLKLVADDIREAMFQEFVRAVGADKTDAEVVDAIRARWRALDEVTEQIQRIAGGSDYGA